MAKAKFAKGKRESVACREASLASPKSEAPAPVTPTSDAGSGAEDHRLRCRDSPRDPAERSDLDRTSPEAFSNITVASVINPTPTFLLLHLILHNIILN